MLFFERNKLDFLIFNFYWSEVKFTLDAQPERRGGIRLRKKLPDGAVGRSARRATTEIAVSRDGQG